MHRWQAHTVTTADPPIAFEGLGRADLQVDRLYRGGSAGHRGDDPLSKLLPVGNAGGFRFVGSPTKGTVRAAVLYTSTSDPDWPDRLDPTSGTFTYYGDNKSPGRALHETPRKGNLFLSRVFAAAAGGVHGRATVPPILLFTKDVVGTDVRFRGLLVPGSSVVPLDEQLVAIWRSSGDVRFQNYRATFTVLDVGTISRAWLDEVLSVTGASHGHAPRRWRKWLATGIADRLLAPKTISYRTRLDQLPRKSEDLAILESVRTHFQSRPHDFEYCAAELWMMLAPATEEIEVTQPSKDGGRDAIGRYALGPPGDLLRIDFALEAKCYATHNAVGVREMSRLISRLRHRQFGVLVTTSFVNQQAYNEIRTDGHPVAVVCGLDIVQVLQRRGFGTASAVEQWLQTQFPAPSIDTDIGGAIAVEYATAHHLADQAK